MNRSVRAGVVAAIVTELLYGLSFVFVKDVTKTISPVTLLAWRFGVALAAVLVLWGFRIVRVRLTRATAKPLLLLAAFMPVAYYLGETFGVARTTASESGLILSAIPVANLLAAWVVLRARPTRWQVTGISVTLVGVVVTVIASGVAIGSQWVGFLLLAGAVVAYALYTVFAQRFADASDMDKTFVMIAAGALVFCTMAIADHARDGTMGVLLTLPVARPGFAIAVAYLAFGCTIGAFFLQNFAISSLGANRYSTFIGIATVTALISGAVVLGERLSIGQWVGGAAIVLGVYLANRRSDRTGAGDGRGYEFVSCKTLRVES